MTLVIDLDNGTTVYVKRFKVDYEIRLDSITGYEWAWYDDPRCLYTKSGAKWIMCEVANSKHPVTIAVRHIVKIAEVDE